MASSRQRTKGSIDFILENPEGYIECKRFTKSLTFGFKSETLKLKWSQVEFLSKKSYEGHLAGIVIQETSDKRLIFVHIRDFVCWWINGSAKSLNVQQALSIGREIDGFEFVNEPELILVKGGANEIFDSDQLSW